MQSSVEVRQFVIYPRRVCTSHDASENLSSMTECRAASTSGLRKGAFDLSNSKVVSSSFRQPNRDAVLICVATSCAKSRRSSEAEYLKMIKRRASNKKLFCYIIKNYKESHHFLLLIPRRSLFLVSIFTNVHAYIYEIDNIFSSGVI